MVNEFTYGEGLPGGIGGLLHLNQSGAAYSYLYDGKGNVTGLLGASGQVVQTYQYDPFGNAMGSSGAINQPMRFSTKSYDDKTGLSYYGYRFYAPALGRWMTRDPLGEKGGINLFTFVDSVGKPFSGMNLYAFCDNNPINEIDPDGMSPFNPNKPFDPKDLEPKLCPRPEPQKCTPVFHPGIYWWCVSNQVLNPISGNLSVYGLAVGLGATQFWPVGLGLGIGTAMADADYCRKMATFCDK